MSGRVVSADTEEPLTSAEERFVNTKCKSIYNRDCNHISKSLHNCNK